MRSPRESFIFLAPLMLVIGAPLAAGENDRPALPGILHYESIGLPHGKLITYDCDGDSIVKRTIPDAGFRRKDMTQKRARPNAEQWATFWETLRRLRVQDWKNDYSPPQTIFDGHEWAFRCWTGLLDVRSGGQNAYPELLDPQKTTMDNAAFSRLTEALENLLNAPAP
jgi:hypothetical protein